jgi:hypothetical protein
MPGRNRSPVYRPVVFISSLSCLILLGCQDQGTPDTQASPATTAQNMDTTVRMPEVALTYFDTASVIDECQKDSLIGTNAELTRHHLYLALCRYGKIARCAELEYVGEPDPSAAVYRYKNMVLYNDTVFDLTQYTQTVMDTGLVRDGTLISPNTLNTVETHKDEVNDELFPSMLLNDSIPDWPGVWKADPPFRK